MGLLGVPLRVWVGEVRSRTVDLKATCELAAAAIDAGQQPPAVPFPRHLWPAPEAADVEWRLARKWNRAADAWVKRRLDPDFVAETRNQFDTEEKAQAFLGWFGDLLHDALFRAFRGSRRLMFLAAAWEENDSRAIAAALEDVLDEAGRGAPEWARVLSAWEALKALKKLEDVDDSIAYVRSSASHALARAHRYGDDRPNDQVVVGPELEREKAEDALEMLSAGLDPEQLLLEGERAAHYERVRLALLRSVRELDESSRSLFSAVAAGEPPIDAEQRLALPRGSWRNLRKKLLRALPAEIFE